MEEALCFIVINSYSAFLFPEKAILSCQNNEVCAKYCIFTHDIYSVFALFMARHVAFHIFIGCISRLLDSVFFMIEN
jgi:hypothetical protein